MVVCRMPVPGDKVVMNDKYYVSDANKGKVWTVASEPWVVGGTLVVKLEGKAGGYAVDGLDYAPLRTLKRLLQAQC